MTSPSTSDSTFFTLPEDLVPSIPPTAPLRTSLDFDGLLDPPLVLESDAKEGCGGKLWPAGMVLAKYLLRCRMDEMRGKTMFENTARAIREEKDLLADIQHYRVELGAGSGLVGLSLALHSPHLTVHLTDLPPMLPLLHKNTHLNPLRSPVHPSVLPWGSPLPASIPPHPAILLAADCVYLEASFPLLLATMHDLLGAETVCYFCLKKRRRADMAFMRLLKKTFAVVDVEDDPDRGVWEREGVFLYEIRRRSGDVRQGANRPRSAGEIRDEGNSSSVSSA